MVSVAVPSYPYAEGELLEQRHNYFYSAFSGGAFLDAWRASRQAARTMALQSRPGAVAQTDAAASATETALRALLAAFDDDGRNAQAWRTLDRYVHRFEVSKRVHAAYDVNLKPIDVEAYRDLGLYVRFAEVLACAARHTRRLSYLSALLKCMDILSAYAGRLAPALGARFAALVIAEAELVAHLQAVLEEGAAC